MARFAFLACFCLVLSSLFSHGQAPNPNVVYPVFDQEVYTAAPQNGTAQFTGSGIFWHSITWIQSGTVNVTGCQVQVDGSTDGITFVAGSVIPSTPCNSSSSTSVSQASSTTAVQWIRVRVTGLTAGKIQVTYLGYTSNPAGTPAFGMPVVQGLGKYQTSNSAVYVSAFNGGTLSTGGANSTQGCAAIYFAISNVLFSGQTVVVDLQGDQPCVSNPIPTSCNSTIMIGPGANYHLQGGSTPATWVIPARCKLIFTGQAQITNGATTLGAASVVSACASGDATCPSANLFPANTPLACFGNLGVCPLGAGGVQVDSVIVGGTFDCRYILGCIGIQNNAAEENSGVFGTAIVGWGNNGIGLDLERGAYNSTAAHLQINNNLMPATCGTTQVGIRINGFAGMSPPTDARAISDVTISGSQCAPANGIEIGGYGVVLSALHIERATTAAINIGSVGTSKPVAGSITVDGLTCVNDVDCVHITATTPAKVGGVSLRSILAGSGDFNVVNDENQAPLPPISATTYPAVSEYVTDIGASVIHDSTYSYASHLGTAGTSAGVLALANPGGFTTNLQTQATSNYNFNLPVNAGSVGQPLLSGGPGISAPMTFSTLGLTYGGTNSSNGAVTNTCVGANATIVAGGTDYFGFATVNTTESLSYVPVSFTGTVVAMHVQVSAAPLNTITFHARYGGANLTPDLTCAVNSSNTQCDATTTGTAIAEGAPNTLDVQAIAAVGAPLGSRNYTICLKVIGVN
jgi:hypothetical protein